MKCFVIMPFSETAHNKDGKTVTTSNTEWQYIFNSWIKKAVESYDSTFLCQRSQTTPNNFTKAIIKDLYESDIVIADLTGQKPNVYYELGIRHSLKLGTIIITQDLRAVPSDLTNYYCFEYLYSQVTYEEDAHFKIFETNLHDKIRFIIENRQHPDNPVADFLDLQHYYTTKLIDSQRNILLQIIESFKDAIIEYTDINDKILVQKDDLIQKNHMPFSYLDLHLINTITSQFYSSNFNHININFLRAVRLRLKLFRYMILRAYQVWESCTKNINKDNINLFLNTIEELKPILDLSPINIFLVYLSSSNYNTLEWKDEDIMLIENSIKEVEERLGIKV